MPVIFESKELECPKCGHPAMKLNYHFPEEKIEWECSNPRCEDSPDNPEMQLQRFHIRLEEHDFAEGDSFWIGDYEFEVQHIARGILL